MPVDLAAENLELYRLNAGLTLENTQLKQRVETLQAITAQSLAERQALAQKLGATHAS